MAPKVWYPVFLDIEGQPVLVVGGGPVAFRKACGLVDAGALVTVVSPRMIPEFNDLNVERRIARPFEDNDIEGATLVFAATDSRQVNRHIGELARTRHVPANVADSLGECGFLVPARVNHEGLQIAISTGGADPKRAGAVRRKLEAWLAHMRT